MVDRLSRIEGIIASRPDGAFYVFANVSKFYSDEVKGSMVFSQRLLEDAYVAVVPGNSFWRRPLCPPQFCHQVWSISKEG